ncbi:hypothetical protein GDO81_013315 [Engystomops pustulosus]|uniref:Coiled-coil domain-containing protein 43 n=1 Tax=Engystomops pustulosus TaxID=76066 RepID=A0AAV7B2F1_ENGPU|nr:hypothetical protein GDO81_013315 [Engystomops pustulosus]
MRSEVSVQPGVRRIAPPPRVGPQPGWKMAAPSEQVAAGDFGAWLDERLEALGMDPEVYPAYITGVLREEENPEERDEALRGILSAFLEEDSIEEVCIEIVTKWCEAEKTSRSQAKAEALFKNTNMEDLVNARKHERDAMREASQKKKEQDKQQRDKDKQAKQERKEKEKKRTQKGERKR